VFLANGARYRQCRQEDAMQRQIKLMPDYHCSALWEDGPGFDNIDPETLPLRPTTRKQLARWIEKYESRLDWSAPPKTTFKTKEEERSFSRWFEMRGIALWRRLRHELGAGYSIGYFSERYQRMLSMNGSEYSGWLNRERSAHRLRTT
jgi:hypothetical protein